VNIPLDERVPARLAGLLTGHSVATVQRRGWAGIKNSELLKLAEKEHDVFVTVDRKISAQQDLTQFKIAVVLIGSRSNRLEDIRPLGARTLRSTQARYPESADHRW
jgi:predicted nuclease of predicted toxin-antitoxin system